MTSPRYLQAHCQSPTSQRGTKLVLKNFQRFKKIKNVTHNPASFVVGSSAVLRLKFCGENRHLRKAANRWWQA